MFVKVLNLTGAVSPDVRKRPDQRGGGEPLSPELAASADPVAALPALSWMKPAFPCVTGSTMSPGSHRGLRFDGFSLMVAPALGGDRPAFPSPPTVLSRALEPDVSLPAPTHDCTWEPSPTTDTTEDRMLNLRGGGL